MKYLILTKLGEIFSKEGEDSTPDERNLFDTVEEARAAVSDMSVHGYSSDDYTIAVVQEFIDA